MRTAWFKYAAAVIIVFGVGTYLWNKKTEIKNPAIVNQSVIRNEITPGSNKAILTLADGTTILLDSVANGVIASQGNSEIIKSSNGTLAYEQLKNNSSRVTPSPAGGGEEGGPNQTLAGTNTMRTPRGGQYQLTLPDGTKAWLNAASSITYPTTFTGKQRIVKISGEVYFEVSKNKNHPFIVQTRTDSITVLGTSFNINAYSDEAFVKTSLLEGAIQINNKILNPGQAYINGKIINANIEQAISWRNGIFRFESEELSSIFRQVSRWYDVEIENRNNINIKFTGIISRKANVSEVLKMLELTGKVHFEIKGKKIIVM